MAIETGPEFESEVDASLAELERLREEIQEQKITIPEPGSPEWEEIRELDSKWGERLRPILSGVEITYLIEPAGGEARTLEEEKKLFMDSLVNENSDFNPTFTYPNLEDIDLDGKDQELSEIREEIKASEETETTPAQRIITQLYHYKINEELAKIRWLKAVKAGDDRRAFHYANFIYGRLRDDHIALGHQRYDEMMSMAGQEEDKSWQEGFKNLEVEQYGPEDIKAFFEAVQNEYNPDRKWDIVITDEVSAITEQSRHPDGPRLAIPIDRKPISVVKLLELSEHEYETHALSAINGGFAELVILSGDIQPDRTEDIKEGKAVVRQKQGLKEIFGSAYPEAGGLPWYILAMEQIQNGHNFRQTFEAVYALRYQYELKASGGDEEIAEKRAKAQTWVTCRRVFRSISDLSTGRRFFPKDKAYLTGERDVRQVIESSHSPWLDIGETNLRILPELFLLGIDPKNIQYPYKNATRTVWGKTLRSKHLAE